MNSWLVARLLTIACGSVLVATTAIAQGLPVKSELVQSKCGVCHRMDSEQRMSRISYQRKTPEGWEETVKRMMRIHRVQLSPKEAREIVEYLSDNQGLTASELEKVSYALELREDPEPVPNEAVKNACTTCHSYGKIAAQRRTKEEWLKLKDFLLAMFPTMVYQHRQIDWPAVADEALGYLAQQFPLETPEWNREKGKPSPGNSHWVVVGHELGKGDYVGQMAMKSTPDGTYQVQAALEFADGTKSTRTSKERCYGGYAWRGSAEWEGGKRAREVFHLSPAGDVLQGRSLLVDHPELGSDEVRYRSDGQARVFALFPKALKRGSANLELKIYGTNLPANPKKEDLNLGDGIRVTAIQEANAERIVAQVSVFPDAKIGRHEVRVGPTAAPDVLSVYDSVDYIRVFPQRGMARVGGVRTLKKFVQFEARAFSRGPDGVEGTEDDIEIGPVKATWGLEELHSDYGDNDLQYVGRIDQNGLFTPAEEGPNPERHRSAENVGDVWVAASYTPDGETKPLKSRAYLLVSITAYKRNLIP